MQTPNPLPQPGAWLVMPDGSQYQVVEPDPVPTPDGPENIYSTATEDGVYYVSVDSGEVIWTPWADVDSAHETDEAAQERADAIAALWPRGGLGGLPLPAPGRYTLTVLPDGTATVEPIAPDRSCMECGDDADAHDWHYDGTHTFV